MTRSEAHTNTLRATGHPLLAAVIAGAAFLAIGFYVLTFGHPHEDAFILFIYSEQLAETGRIAYFDGGPRAEGATDFLWMAAIAGLNVAGVSSGMAALVLNALGIAVLAGLVTATASRLGGDSRVAAGCAALVPLFGFVQSGYGGFSAPAYAAHALAISLVLLRARGAMLLAVPFLSIALGLFRPDGVVLGVGFTLVGLALAPRALRLRYLTFSGLAAVIGVVYFLWRWSYFDSFLPLPLLVKSEGDALLNGLGANRRWFADAAWLILAALALVPVTEALRARAVPVALPALALLVFLTFGVQSQNIAFRFQAPVTALLFAFVVIGLSCLAVRLGSGRAAAGLVAGFLAMVLVFEGPELRREVHYLTNDDYINFMPVHLAGTTPDDATIALTEAGRLAYWMPGRFHDLVGLNTEHTARFGADAAYIRSLDPDLIFVHTAHTAVFACEADFCLLSEEAFREAVEGLAEAGAVRNRVQRAPLAVYAYLSSAPGEYDILVVRYERGHPHLYAVPRDGRIALEALTGALSRSFEADGRMSYGDALDLR